MVEMRKRNLILLLSLCTLFSIGVNIPRVNGFVIYTQELSGTHRINEIGVWVEVTLNVRVIYYHTGAKSFSYSMDYARGLPWCWIWIWGSGEGASLQIEGGMWTADHQRYAWMYIIPFVALGMYSKVHFNEAEMQFYYSEKSWGSGEVIIEAILQAMEPDF